MALCCGSYETGGAEAETGLPGDDDMIKKLQAERRGGPAQKPGGHDVRRAGPRVAGWVIVNENEAAVVMRQRIPNNGPGRQEYQVGALIAAMMYLGNLPFGIDIKDRQSLKERAAARRDGLYAAGMALIQRWRRWSSDAIG